MLFFSKKPTIWIVSDGKDTCVQSWAIAKNITDDKHIIEFDRLHAHSAKKDFPDLAIGVGYGCTETLEGIKASSNGKTKITVILDPLKDHENFDFIILPSYEPYHLEGDNIIHTTGLVTYINHDFLEKQKKLYKKSPKYGFLRNDENMKPPYIGVLIGGRHTGGNVDINDARSIANSINQLIQKRGNGTALITTSARTEFETAREIFQNLTVPNIIYDYKLRETDNPYDIFLSLADELIVTSDSVRMMCEAASSGKKVWLYKPNELGFQYEPLVKELIDGGYALDINSNDENYVQKTLNEAYRVASLIKERLK